MSPSEASVDAALADATTNPDGTLAFNYTDTADAAAYPEPVVFYAAVSTAPQAAAQAAAIKKVLDNIAGADRRPREATPCQRGSCRCPRLSRRRQRRTSPRTSSPCPRPAAEVSRDQGEDPVKGSTHPSGGGSQTGSGDSTSTGLSRYDRRYHGQRRSVVVGLQGRAEGQRAHDLHLG